MRKIMELIRSTRAATAVEYGLLIACIFMICVVAIGSFSSAANVMWNKVSNNVTART